MSFGIEAAHEAINERKKLNDISKLPENERLDALMKFHEEISADLIESFKEANKASLEALAKFKRVNGLVEGCNV